MTPEEENQLRREIEQLREQLKHAERKIKLARDISPVERPSFKRVIKMVHDACMELKRVAGGWLLSMGNRTRRFRKLSDIWNIFLEDDWYLSDVLPYPAPPTPPRKLEGRELLRAAFSKRNTPIAPKCNHLSPKSLAPYPE